MTSIKPPPPPDLAGTGILEGATSVDPTTGAAGTAEATEVAGGAQASTGVGGVDAVDESRAAAGADPMAELSAAVACGELSAAEAAEQLIDRAIEGVGAHLDAAQRAELASVLRAALESDPALRDALGSPRP